MAFASGESVSPVRSSNLSECEGSRCTGVAVTTAEGGGGAGTDFTGGGAVFRSGSPVGGGGSA